MQNETKSQMTRIDNPEEEAKRLYQMIKQITDKGNDAEVKKIKGKLKIVEIRKQIVSEL